MRLDRRGLVLVSTGVPLVVYGFTVWDERATMAAAAVWAPLAAGTPALVAFALHSRRSANPVLDLRLFANRSYAAAAVTSAFTGAALFGAGLLFPLYFLIGRGETPLATGVLLISLSVGTVLVLPLSGRLVDRFGGVVSMAGGLAIALAVVPAGTTAYKAVSAAQLPDATTQINLLMRMGGALGGAVFAVVLASRLPDGAAAAFHASFWGLTAASTLGLGSAVWLTLAERRLAAAAAAPDLAEENPS